MRTVILARYGSPGDHLIAVTFPYDEGVRALVRDVPGRRWLEAKRTWVVPDNPASILRFREGLTRIGWGLTMSADVREALNAAHNATVAAHEVRKAGDAEVEWPLRTTPYAHQRAGLAFLSHLGGGALLWEMGLGKTAAAIAYCETLADGNARCSRCHGPMVARPISETFGVGGACSCGGLIEASPLRVLVICPNTVRRNWGQEIDKHAGHEDFVIPDGDYKRRIPQLALRRYTILNTEALSHATMVAALMEREWDVVIVDESTRFKGPKAARTKALLKLRAKRRLILTGTPITNSPEDAWAPFEFVSPGLFGKSFFQFADRYLTKDYFGAITGIKPDRAGELRERIGSVSYRILKADVLDLPPKVYVDRTVTLDGEQHRAYVQMRDELRVAYEAGEIQAFNVLTQLLRLTQITAGLIGEGDRYQWIANGAKVKELEALLDEIGGEPVVIFGQYQKELEALALRFDDHAAAPTPPIIYGPTPESVRHNLIEQFQRGERRRLFVQSRTGGIGINLTAARTAIYYTRGWSLEEYLQSQDRLHRIGQTGTVTIVHLIAEGTVDEQIAKALAEKRDLADDLTGDNARSIVRQVLGMDGTR